MGGFRDDGGYAFPHTPELSPDELARRALAPADQGAFLRSEKDTRPYDETYQRAAFLPIGVNGYNNTPEPRHGGPLQQGQDVFSGLNMPGMVHDSIAASHWFGNAIRGQAPLSEYNTETGETHTPDEAIAHINNLVGLSAGASAGAVRPSAGAVADSGSFIARDPSALAERMYAALSRRGYNVQRAPEVGGATEAEMQKFNRSKYTVGPRDDPTGPYSLYSNSTEEAAPALAAGQQQQGIRAYHGSPHDFDKFDLSKIGSGEGAQAFGHGLYFSGEEAVARNYKETVKKGSGAEQHASMALENMGRGEAKGFLVAQGDELSGAGLKDAAAQYYEASKLVSDANWKPGQGHMYEVNINARPDHFLDWDKPLSQQSENVRGALDKMPPIIQRERDSSIRPQSSFMAQEKAVSTEDFYRQLAKYDLDPTAASEIMREAGIPGIRYLDQGSRSAGEGSSNYVVFNHDLIDIMRKYANHPTAAPAGIAASRGQELSPDDIKAALKRFKLIN